MPAAHVVSLRRVRVAVRNEANGDVQKISERNIRRSCSVAVV